MFILITHILDAMKVFGTLSDSVMQHVLPSIYFHFWSTLREACLLHSMDFFSQSLHVLNPDLLIINAVVMKSFLTPEVGFSCFCMVASYPSVLGRIVRFFYLPSRNFPLLVSCVPFCRVCFWLYFYPFSVFVSPCARTSYK